MYCPECRAEFGPGFTRCADCDVNLVPEMHVELSGTEGGIGSGARHPARDSIARFRTKSLTSSALTFGLHQFIGMYGVPFTAPLVFSLGFKILFFFGHVYSKRDFYSKLTETPYFPVQVIFAMVLGWLLGRSLGQKSILWVWVLPLAILSYSFIALPISLLEATSILDQLHARLSHLFGWGCRPALHCFDQALVTLPFYSCLAYSTGALLAQRTMLPRPATSRKLTLAIMTAGLIILISLASDLIVSIQQTGWQRNYWFIIATPLGLSAYLLYVSSIIRQRERHRMVRHT